MNMQWPAGFCHTLHPNELTKTPFLWTAMHCTALHCTALNCTTLPCTALRCPALDWTALRCTTLRCTALCCTTPRCTTPRCNALYSTFLHCIAHHFTALYCTALHCTALCCSALCKKRVRKCPKWGFLVLVLLSAHVNIMSVSRMREFFVNKFFYDLWREQFEIRWKMQFFNNLYITFGTI